VEHLKIDTPHNPGIVQHPRLIEPLFQESV
jgi:hypothetical protein